MVVNQDNNSVVWMSDGKGRSVLEEFFRQLTPEQIASIKAVSGDGAKWITSYVEEYVPEALRCCDPFHVVQWATEALDELRKRRISQARKEYSQMKKEHPQKIGRPKKEDAQAQETRQAKDKVTKLKFSKYALGKGNENLTENQRVELKRIELYDKPLYRAYVLKEDLREILKVKDAGAAEEQLKKWMWRASHSQIDEFKELYQKIKRNYKYIMNFIQYGLSNARIEAINNKIKLLIRRAYGFRNIINLFSSIYLECSNLKVPLRNHDNEVEYCF